MDRLKLRQIARFCLALGLCFVAKVPVASATDETSVVQLPDGRKLLEVDFQRHVLPLMTRFGCNVAACHGSFQGRGGFRLSLFGQAPANDLEAILDRVDVDDPEESLILTKPSLRTEHGGGRRFAVDSWPYQVLAAWIRKGARASTGADGDKLERLAVAPAVLRLQRSEAGTTVEVQAHFKGSSCCEMVTPFSRFESRDPGVVEVTADGKVRAIRPGATYLVVTYAGGYTTVPVTIPFSNEPAGTEGAAVATPSVSEKAGGFIDTLIRDRLGQLNLSAAPAADDAQFLRRATLDTVGRLPTTDEVRQFLSSQDIEKRTQAIDRLLSDSQHASLWATRLCDLTGCRLETMEGPDKLKPVRARMWHDWFRRRLVEHVPLDQLVRGVISGTSRDGLSPEEFIDREASLIHAAESGGTGDYSQRRSLDLFYRRRSLDGVYPREALAERVAAAFMGIRIQCARCHQHPYDRWTQGDYAAFVNVFADVTFGSSTDLNRAVLARLAEQRSQRAHGAAGPPATLPRLQEVYDDPRQAERLPSPGQTTAAHPRPLGGPDLVPTVDARAALAEWLVRRDNPWFARNWVNRVWAHYFGRGLVDPVDGFSATNPPTHPELLDRLAAEFVESGYDMSHIERLILTSVVYQRSSTSPAGVRDADRHYACMAVRPIMAEAAVQILDQALKSPARWTADVSPGGSLFDLASSRPTDQRLAYLLDLFGRGTRESVCDCDRSPEPSLRQTLHLMSDATWIEQVRKSPLIDELLVEPDIKLAVQNAVVQTLTRFPSPTEEDLFCKHLGTATDRRAAWIDIVWALVNSREFRTNH
jgi:Protein of unknown function (DUF1549)/Protein of unknown function (DUF1553)